MASANRRTDPVALVENRNGASDFLIVCEHASNRFPDDFGDLGLGADVRAAHVAWDIGALQLARKLAERLNACLVSATVSRLIYDLNRPPGADGAMPARSEIHNIPGNANLSSADRLRRAEAVYLPFHAALHAEIARRLALGRATILVTVHSFTPVYFGQPRAVEFGVIHDADPAFARAVQAAARDMTGLDARINEPYSAADGVTHTLRLQATPYGITSVMLEIRNDLLSNDRDLAGMANRLARVLVAAWAEVSEASKTRRKGLPQDLIK